MSETTRRTNITQVVTVIVPVSDQDLATEFYVETLGFEKVEDFQYGRPGGHSRDVSVPRSGRQLVPDRPAGLRIASVHLSMSPATEQVDPDLRARTPRDVTACISSRDMPGLASDAMLRTARGGP
jgi:hypothetical protein